MKAFNTRLRWTKKLLRWDIEILHEAEIQFCPQKFLNMQRIIRIKFGAIVKCEFWGYNLQNITHTFVMFICQKTLLSC